MAWIPTGLFPAFLPHLPSLLATMAGMAVAAALWRRAGTSALWALAGFGVLAACEVWAAFNPYLIVWLHSLGITIQQTTRLASFIDLGRSLLAALGIGCLVIALAWGWRSGELGEGEPAVPG